MRFEYRNLPIEFDEDGNPYVETAEAFVVEDHHDNEKSLQDVVPWTQPTPERT